MGFKVLLYFNSNNIFRGFSSQLWDLKYKDLSKLREWLGGDLVVVNGEVDCRGNEVLKSLGGCGLKVIGIRLDIRRSDVIVDLGELEYLGDRFYCDEDKVEYFRNSKWGEILKLK